MEGSFVFFLRTKVVVGKGSVGEIKIELEKFGVKKPMLVTDKILRRETNVVSKVEEALEGIEYVVFDEVEPDSECSIVDKAYEFARRNGVDSIISVGGGSSIDTAKAVCILYEKGGKIKEHSGVYLLSKDTIPHISVPTTAGTGSEVTHVAVIKDEEEKRKLIYVDSYLMPRVAILDPELTVSMPRSVTAYTGMDAITHCIEAIHSTSNNPVSDSLALHGLRLAFESLPRVLEEPSDIKMRQNMQVAAMLGGAAFANAQVGVVHAIAHSLGSLYGIPHGLANSLILPYGMSFNLPECPRYKLVAEVMGIYEEDEKKAGKKAIEKILSFIQKIGLPATLKEVGRIRKEDFGKIAELSIGDPSIVSNPRFAISEDAIIEILENAWDGRIA